VVFDGVDDAGRVEIPAADVAEAIQRLTYADPAKNLFRRISYAHCWAHVDDRLRGSYFENYHHRITPLIHTSDAVPVTYNIPFRLAGGATEWYHSALFPELLEEDAVQDFLRRVADGKVNFTNTLA